MRRPSTARPLLLVVAAALAAAPFGPSPVAAQPTPADSASILLDAARRFEDAGQPEVAQALYRHLMVRFAQTPSARVAETRLTQVRMAATAGSGRVELQVWSTLYGLWLGVAVPAALGADGEEAYGLGLIVGGPLGFASGRALARTRDLTEGQARAITLGGTWGTWQGGGWAEVLDLGVREVCQTTEFGEFCYEEGDGSEELFASMIVGGLAGVAVGTVLSRRTVPPGVATTVNFGSLWGTWFGFAGGYLADLDGDALLASTLVGGDAGLVATALLAPGWDLSRNRARLISISGVIGALSGLGVNLIAQPDDDKVGVGITLAASLAGLGIGVAATRSYDRPSPGGEGSGAGDAGGAGGDREAGEAPGGTLLQHGEGRWSLGVPLPYPVRVEAPVPGGVRTRTALGVTWLGVRF